MPFRSCSTVVELEQLRLVSSGLGTLESRVRVSQSDPRGEEATDLVDDREAVAELSASVASSIGRQHGVDDDASDRDIEPNRESESGQAPVRGKATAEREKKSDENHRQGHDRETDMRDEQREVHITNRALA